MEYDFDLSHYDDVYLDHLIQVVSARLVCKVTFPFLINKYYVGRYLNYVNALLLIYVLIYLFISVCSCGFLFYIYAK